MIEIDCRGLSCPIPVLRTKKAVEKNPSEEFQIIVDTSVTKDNVKRFLTSRAYEVTEEKPLGDAVVILARRRK